MPSRRTVFAALSVASVIVLAGCASSTEDNTDGALQIVASTNVYGDIAKEIGGDAVEVTSIIHSLSQDPHSYEASVRDQLTVKNADLVIENGGGYDAFIDALIEASGTDAAVITAAEYSHDWPENAGHTDEEIDHDHADEKSGAHTDHEHIEGFNEHVWYDPHTITHVADAIAHRLSELDPDNTATFEANAEGFAAQVEGLEKSLSDIDAAHAGEKIFATEPVPLYLITAAGLVNATPSGFSEAVEEGQDVPPATLLEAMDVLKAGDVRTVIVNAQTGGAETTEVTAVAGTQDIPVLEFTELLPEGMTYLSWMTQNIADLAGTLTR